MKARRGHSNTPNATYSNNSKVVQVGISRLLGPIHTKCCAHPKTMKSIFKPTYRKNQGLKVLKIKTKVRKTKSIVTLRVSLWLIDRSCKVKFNRIGKLLYTHDYYGEFKS